MSDFVRVCKVGDIPDPGKQVFEVGERYVVLFHVDGRFYALDDVCTHDGGPLGEGFLEGSRLPVRGTGPSSTFATAACCACRPPAARLRTTSRWKATRCS